MESSTRKAPKARSRLERIVRSAEELFCRQGIAETSMDQIAEAVPVAKMTLYKYAGSKERLLDLVLDSMLERGKADFQAILEKAASPLEVLTSLTQYKGMDHVTAVFIQDLMRLYPEKGAALIANQQQTMGPLIERVIFEGQQQGHIRKDVSPHIVILFMMSMKDFLSRSEAMGGSTDLRAMGEQIVSIFFYGIIAPGQKSE